MFAKLRLFRKFRFNKWKTYSPQKRLEYAQMFENYYAKKQGRENYVVVWREMQEKEYGLCVSAEKIIYISADLITTYNKMFLLMSTLLHEGRHSFQYFYVNKEYSNKSKISKFSKAYKWKNSLGGYLSGAKGENDYTDYANQSIELDANMYAYKQLKKLRRKYSTISEYNEEMLRLEEWFEYVAHLGKEKYGMFYKFKINRKNKKQYKKNRK